MKAIASLSIPTILFRLARNFGAKQENDKSANNQLILFQIKKANDE